VVFKLFVFQFLVGNTQTVRHRNIRWCMNSCVWGIARMVEWCETRSKGKSLKAKFTIEQDVKTHRENIGIAVLFLWRWCEMMGVGIQRHAPTALRRGRRRGSHHTRGWVGPRDGLDGSGKISLPPGFDPLSVHPVASRYTGSRRTEVLGEKFIPLPLH